MSFYSLLNILPTAGISGLDKCQVNVKQYDVQQQKCPFFRTFVNRYMYKRMVKSESFLLSLNANFKLKRINFFHQIKQ